MQITFDGAPVTGFESDKVRALLAYLAVEASVPHSREKLAGLLWPELPETTARARVRRVLANLRRVIRDHDATPFFLFISRQTIQFNSASDAWVDAATFVQLLEKTSPPQQALRRMEEAVTLYRGRFLEGFSLPDSAALEEWALLRGEWFRREVLSAIHRLAATYEEHGDHERALQHAWHAVELEPWEEKAHRHVMRLLAHSGRRGAALAQFEACRRTLVEELGIRPSAATLRLYEQIRSEELAVPSRVTTPAVPERSPQLPAYLKVAREPERQPFVAREQELARLEGFLHESLTGEGKVVFVSGDAGSGKTSLLAEFARRGMEAHPDLLSAWGTCSAYAGTGAPFLPFRELLSMLTGDVKARWMAGIISSEHARRLWYSLPDVAQLLLKHGLDLIPSLVDGTALLSRAALVAPSASGWLQTLYSATERRLPRLEGMEPGYHFEQYTHLLQELAVQHPLVLILDDLQWPTPPPSRCCFTWGGAWRAAAS